MPSQNQRALGRRQGLSVQPSHTNKLQDLYNNWRDAEDSEKLETYLRLGPEGLGNQEEGGSQGDGAAVPRQDVAKRRRTGRYTAVQLAKGAFKRALGACVGCHKRKVECNHWALEEFEAAYRPTKREKVDKLWNAYQGGAGPGVDTDFHGLEHTWALQGTLTDAPWAVYSHPGPTDDDTALLGDTLTRLSSGSANIWPDSFHQAQTEGMSQVISIGRQQRSGIGMWECLFDFGEVSVAEGGTGNLCGVQYHSQADVLKHYANAHLPVELVEPSKWFHCRTCGQWNDVAWDCLQCEMVDFGAQEEWLCGFAVSKRPAVTERQMTVTEEVEGPTEIDEVGMAYSTIYWSGFPLGEA